VGGEVARSEGISERPGGVSGQGQQLRFTIPSLPPSVNALHQIIYSQRRVELKPEVRRWRTTAKEYVPRCQWRSQSSIIRVDIIAYYRMFTSEGKLREFDTQNLLKPLIDLIAEKQGWNDRRAKSGSWDTADSVTEKVEVTLREVALERVELELGGG
jgi:hypothetical protein